MFLDNSIELSHTVHEQDRLNFQVPGSFSQFELTYTYPELA